MHENGIHGSKTHFCMQQEKRQRASIRLLSSPIQCCTLALHLSDDLESCRDAEFVQAYEREHTQHERVYRAPHAGAFQDETPSQPPVAVRRTSTAYRFAASGKLHTPG